ncbi:MAG: hypothetical protein P8X88_03545 [Gammaproteobacteria bacterium]
MKMRIYKYRSVLSALFIILITALSFPTHASGVKIIISGHGNYRHNHYYRHFPTHDYSRRLYNKYYFDQRANGNRDQYGKPIVNRYYGNRSYGYGEGNGYSDRYYIRSRGGYCPY